MTDMRYLINLVESASIVDLGSHKLAKSKKKVNDLVRGFQAYLDSVEKFKEQFGRFEPLLREYENDPAQNIPVFKICVKFDRIASRQEKFRLKKNGFVVFNDDPEWGTEIYDHGESKSWTHGGHNGTGKNWYTQTLAVKEISLEEAEKIWVNRNNLQTVYGLYQPEDIHYNKDNLVGNSKKGWDIRTHPDHGNHYHENGMSFFLEMVAPNYGKDCAIKNDKYFADAIRVYKVIQQAEQIRNSVAPEKVKNLSDYRK